MYAALWRLLPGPVWVRLLLCVVLAAAVLTALVLWIFPAINELFVPPEVTVGE
jgi:hypothetical protein